jgi:RNA polymerase sigma-70 factor (ECF subfamily)
VNGRGETNPVNPNFTELVKKARKGDASAFASLYREHYKDLYRIAFLNLRNEDDAADAVSDAVLDAFSSLKNLRDENAFKSWFISILYAKIKKTQKGYIKSRQHDISIDDESSGITNTAGSEFAFDTAEVKQAFSKLDDDERIIISLSAVSGYKSDEIGKTLGISANTVRSKAARARNKLKQLLS